ncbi:SLAM family member 5-like [Trachemys scripta elegans]|uniref:SLAM family member 5-like n=1 Tax=Trachemys scripta elegans TaxID=31138 RepID=UPI0015541435|nr:SLAM family member 5-like [Trachemys scripta elegans]
MELSRILGDSVTFPLGIPAQQVKSAFWTVNTTKSLVTVAAGNPPTVIVGETSYEGRLRVPESNLLQITSLRMEDTGTYSAKIITATDPIFRHFPLRVYKRVPKPTVLCDPVTCVNETCNYNLRCTVRDGGEHVTYNWTHTAEGAVVANKSILHISLSPRDAHLAVTCTAQNPASNSSTMASAKDLCAAPTTTTTTEKPPASQSASTTGIAVPIVIVIVGLLSIALWFVYTHKRKRASQKSRKSTSGPASSAGTYA